MIKFLPVEMIILYHDKMVDEYGGLKGIRDMGLLQSALEIPKACIYGEDLHPTLIDKASAYLFHIVCNQPFNDGNKRTGGFAAVIFLELNGINTEFSDKKYEHLIVEVAKGEAKKIHIVHFFQINLIKKN